MGRYLLNFDRSHAVYDIAPPKFRLSIKAIAGCHHVYKEICSKKQEIHKNTGMVGLSASIF